MAKILVAEDEPDIQTLIMLTLQHAGHEAIGADDGQAAYELALRETPDLIVMDVMMPRLNGYDACRRIRAVPGLARTPVVFLSVRGAETEIAAGFAAGGDEYLVKPFAPDELVRTVAKTLARKQAGAALPPVA